MAWFDMNRRGVADDDIVYYGDYVDVG
jgi:hypothetical protein